MRRGQRDAERAAGVPVRVIGIRGHEERIPRHVAPPAEDRVRPGHANQAQAVRFQQARQPDDHFRRGARLFEIFQREREWNQPAGGLFHAAVRVVNQPVGDGEKAVRQPA